MKALNEDLLEQVLEPDNIDGAWEAVKANPGAAGVDGIGIGETEDHMSLHWGTIRSKLLAGTYKPAPVRPVRIPKPGGGGERVLGVNAEVKVPNSAEVKFPSLGAGRGMAH